jgi:beta-lactamase regulating signal transducer with metallopeptidase domain
VAEEPDVSADQGVAEVAAPAPATVSEPAADRNRFNMPLSRMLIAAWLAGVILALGYHLWSRLRLRRVIRHAKPASGHAAVRYHGVGVQLGLKRLPRLLITNGLESPAIVGTLCPTILLPAWLVADPASSKLDWSIRHELTHYRWLDPWGVFLRDIALILFWFHPAVRWSANRPAALRRPG